MAEDKSGKKMIAVNREVRHEYFVIEALETGIELVGTEVKSLRAGGVNLKDSWADIDDGELIAKGIHISPYEQGNIFNKDPRRPRRLLAHKAEIRRLSQQIKLQGPPPGHSLEKLPAVLPEKTVLIRDGIHLHSEYSLRLQKGYFGVKVLFVNKKRTKSESCRMRICPLAQGWFLRR